MRAWLLVCAALALAPGRPRAASATPAATAAPPAPPAHTAHSTHTAHTAHTSHLATITHTTHDSQTAHSAHQAHSAHSEHSAHPHTLADPARLDHIKTQILAKLGLRTRPRPLGAPPRDVVRQILARAADTHTERPPEEDHSMREIIAIAHRGETLNGQRLIEFRLGHEAESEQGLAVARAELLVRAEVRSRRPRFTLWAFTVAGNGSETRVGPLAGAARGAGRAWQRLDVTRAARQWAARGARAPLRLLLDCSGCAGRVRLRLGGAAAARPLLRLTLAARAARRRRALDCDAAARGRCCRQTYYVSFRALGWDDWIVAPEGYYANYCRGACAPFLNYHAQVVEAARLERAACCAPVRFSALSLIYFGADSNIIKRDLPEMVVEECDCP